MSSQAHQADSWEQLGGCAPRPPAVHGLREPSTPSCISVAMRVHPTTCSCVAARGARAAALQTRPNASRQERRARTRKLAATSPFAPNADRAAPNGTGGRP